MTTNHNCDCENHSHEEDTPVLETCIIGGVEYNLTKEDIYYLNELIDIADDHWEVTSDLTTVILAYFVIGKNDEAWKLIESSIENIDLTKIISSPYFKISTSAVSVYRYMYDNGILDPVQYSQMNIICNTLDREYWTDIFNKCGTVSDMLKEIHLSYGTLNPLDVGLIDMPEWVWDIIIGKIKDDEFIDEYIIGDEPGLRFMPDQIRYLIDTNHIDKTYLHVYCDMLYLVEKYTTNDIHNRHDIFKMAADNKITIGGSTHSSITFMDFSEFETLTDFIDYVCDLDFEHDDGDTELFEIEENLLMILFNNINFITNPYTLYNMIPLGIDIKKYKVSRYLHVKNYAFVNAYKFLPFMDTSDFVVLYPMMDINYPCIYCASTSMLHIPEKNIKIDDNLGVEDIINIAFPWVDSDTLDENIFDICKKSHINYNELKLEIEVFAYEIANME